MRQWVLGISTGLLIVQVQGMVWGQSFQNAIAPLLAKRCLECHTSTDPAGGLDLTTAAGLHKGGDSGAAISQEQPLQSLLLQRVMADEMPPAKNGKPRPLSSQEKESLQQWSQKGYPWPDGMVLDPYDRTTDVRGGRDWWAFQKIVRPTIPSEDSSLHPIDALLRKTLESKGLSPAPPATPQQLLRRLSYDLIGLPPTADEVDAFVESFSEKRYEQEVDRLLASPQFGERWGRYWLDVVRYAETNGYERDALKPHAWKYRDWVIRALNDDMPYDRFLLEQLAGDEIEPRTESAVVATGFLRLGTWDDEPNDPFEYQYDRLEDLVHATSTAFLGLTVKCARCHDHKFDPIPQRDYYKLAAAFWAGPVAHRKREWNGGPTSEELGYEVLGWTDLSSQPPPLHLLKKGNPHHPGEAVEAGGLSLIGVSGDSFTPQGNSKTTMRRTQLAQWLARPDHPLTSRVAVNRIWLHLLGEGLVRTPDNFGFQSPPPVHPALLDWLASELQSQGWRLKPIIKQIVMSQTYRQSSMHPSEAALAVIDPNNHYFWRANRRRLDAESLRDSLLKASGRLDLRMGGPSFHASIDAEALEGLSMKESAYKASPEEEQRRRSIYMFVKRSLVVPMMTVFDCCDTTAPTGRRDVTIVAPQALTLMNNQTIQRESREIAGRVLAQSSDEVGRIHTAWRIVLGRSPSTKEISFAQKHLLTMAQHWESKPLLELEKGSQSTEQELWIWASLCHVLINTNEFIFID